MNGQSNPLEQKKAGFKKSEKAGTVLQNNANPEKNGVEKSHAKSENSGFFNKNLRTHIFEFFMLFLAVFCGFMADNWREQMTEHKRELVFVRSLVEDVKSDTLESGRTIDQLRIRHNGLNTILDAILTPEVKTNSNEIYRIWTKNLGLDAFVSNDRTIQQLKSSGELRLIRNKAVSDRIMKYDQLLKQYNRQSELMYDALPNVTSYAQLFDFVKLVNNPDVPVPLTENGIKYLNQAYAHLFLWNRGLEGLIGWLKVVNEEGKDLVLFIEKEYNL